MLESAADPIMWIVDSFFRLSLGFAEIILTPRSFSKKKKKLSSFLVSDLFLFFFYSPFLWVLCPKVYALPFILSLF
jgi:hypothetical protein